jgi:hypothetical protein
MHRASIEFLADFHDELPRWGLRSTIQLQQPITFSLISHPRISAAGYELVLLHQGGGQVKRSDIHSDECRNDTGIKAFARLRDLLLQRWPQPQQASASGTGAR